MNATQCPPRDKLSAFLMGRLPEDVLEVVAEHIDQCRTCQGNLPALDTGNDPLLPSLRHASHAPPPHDSDLDRLLAQVKALVEAPSRDVELPTRATGDGLGQIGPYRLLEVLGGGGMGKVYRALHQPLEMLVALKVVRRELAQHPNVLARFQREIKALGKLRHPHIVRATDAGEAAGVLYLVMELVEGIDLHHLVERQGPLPVADGCELIRQAALGLQHAHEHGLVHRDIKPANLMLADDGLLKVLDLGLARVTTDALGAAGLTAPDQVMGTLDYLAPEQAANAHTVDIRADIYSLGCTLYHLLAGRPPYAGSSYAHPVSKLAAHLKAPLPPLRQYRPEVPEVLVQVLTRMTAKDPAERFATPSGVASALAPLAVGSDLARLRTAAALAPAAGRAAPPPTGPGSASTLPEPVPGQGQEAEPVHPRHRWFGAGLAAALLLVAALSFAALHGFFPTSPNSAPSLARGPSTMTGSAQLTSSLETHPKDLPTGGDLPGVKEPPPAKEPDKKEPEKQEPATKIDDTALAEKGVAFLKHYCYRCHGVDYKVPRLNVLDRAGLTAPRAKDALPYLTPGKPDQSLLWQHVGVERDMPPSQPRPTADERQLFRQWIAAGAVFPGRPARPFQSETAIITAILTDLRRVRPGQRRFQRYFTLTHLANNHAGVTDDDLRLYRAALAKLVNSLSWKPDIIRPQAIDGEQTMFRIDLRDLGWDEHDLWKEILKEYPYGLSYRTSNNTDLRKAALELAELSDSDLAYLRADWFIATASRPPLYHTLLQLPKDASELERQLKVNITEDFLRGKLARAGFTTSGVSKQNRLVDRHGAGDGRAYWKSYDFKTNESTGNLVKFPLGPRFAEHPFPRQAFEHAGGEVIFSLPNGMQGYLLVDEQDRRIDTGPIDVVRDVQETAGGPAVVNGLSCLACHKHGVIRFEDKLRNGTAVGGDARDKVEELFHTKEQMDALLDRDEERFLRALEQAIGNFLRIGQDKDKSLKEFPEPIGAIARLYVQDLGLREAALELGIEDPNKLKDIIQQNRELRELGLGTLSNGGTIKRQLWGSREFTVSLFHQVARELGLGTPLVPF